MVERNADCHHRGLNFLVGCTNDPSVDSRCRLNHIGTGVEVDGRQDRVDKGTIASSAWPLEIALLHHLYMNVWASRRGMVSRLPFKPSLARGRLSRFHASERSDRLDPYRWLRSLGEQGFPFHVPCGV